MATIAHIAWTKMPIGDSRSSITRVDRATRGRKKFHQSVCLAMSVVLLGSLILVIMGVVCSAGDDFYCGPAGITGGVVMLVVGSLMLCIACGYSSRHDIRGLPRLTYAVPGAGTAGGAQAPGGTARSNGAPTSVPMRTAVSTLVHGGGGSDNALKVSLHNSASTTPRHKDEVEKMDPDRASPEPKYKHHKQSRSGGGAAGAGKASSGRKKRPSARASSSNVRKASQFDTLPAVAAATKDSDPDDDGDDDDERKQEMAAVSTGTAASGAREDDDDNNTRRTAAAAATATTTNKKASKKRSSKKRAAAAAAAMQGSPKSSDIDAPPQLDDMPQPNAILSLSRGIDDSESDERTD